MYFGDFINVFSRMATAFHRRAKLFEMNFFIRKTRWPNKAGKIVLRSSQVAHCPALTGTPVLPGEKL